MVNNSKAFQIAKYAIMFAVIFVAMMIDKAISIIPVPFSMAACVLLVTLSFCFLENKWHLGVLSGAFFGISSFIKEFLLPSPLIAQVFPPQYWLLITIPPRVLMGALAFATYRLMLLLTRKMQRTKGRQILCMVVATFVGLVVNTVGFFTFVELSRMLYGVETKGIFYLIYACLVTNIIPEYAISLASVPFVVLGVRRGLKLGMDGNNGRRIARDAALQAQVTAEETKTSTDGENL